jgi:hypothetical protein
MAAKSSVRSDFRASAERLRKEGERLVERIDRDVRALAKKTRGEFAGDVRKLEAALRGRATDAIRDIEARSARVAAQTAETVLRRVHGATQSDLAAVLRRLQDIEARVATLEEVVAQDRSAV